MRSNQHVRQLAFALLLATSACGDDSGDDDDVLPPGDAGGDASTSNDASANDAGLDASTDGGARDGGELLDARLSDGSTDDAGANELQAALERTGVRVDARRAQLVIGAFCETGVRCNFNDAGVSLDTCLQATNSGWAENLTLDYTQQCLDTQLDLLSCAAVTACDQQSQCDSYRSLQDQQCE